MADCARARALFPRFATAFCLALATVVCAAVLGGAFTHLLGGATAGLAPAVGVAADVAHKSAATFSLWLVASMLAGALSASLAAIEGGNLRNRNGIWKKSGFAGHHRSINH